MKFVFLIFTLLATFSACTMPSLVQQTNRQDSPSLSVKLLSLREQRTKDDYYLVGEIQNISNQKITSIWAIANFYDSNGNLIRSDENIIQFPDLEPNQTSSYRIIADPDIKAKQFKVLFRSSISTMLNVVDERKVANK